MEQIQYLTNEQISGIISFMETNIIYPAIKDERERIFALYADKKVEIIDALKEHDEKYGDLLGKCRYDISYYFDQYVEKFYVINTWQAHNKIVSELRERLTLTAAGNFDDIVKRMIETIDVTKYIKLRDPEEVVED